MSNKNKKKNKAKQNNNISTNENIEKKLENKPLEEIKEENKDVKIEENKLEKTNINDKEKFAETLIFGDAEKEELKAKINQESLKKEKIKETPVKETPTKDVINKDIKSKDESSQTEKDKKIKDEKTKKETSIEKKIKDNKIKNELIKVENKKEIMVKKENDKDESLLKRKVLFYFLVILIIVALISIFSTIYALIGKFKTTIAKGVTISGVDVSNLTKEEAKNKIEEVAEIKLIGDIELRYKDYVYKFKTTEINFDYNVDLAVEEAYNIAKKGNILENNFNLIKSVLVGTNVELKNTFEEEILDGIINLIDTNIPSRLQNYNYYIEENKLIVKPGIDGVLVNKELLKSQIIDSVNNRNYQEIIDNNSKDYDFEFEIPVNNVKADKIDINEISSKVCKEPKDAYYVPATENTKFEIHPDIDGVSFAISNEEAQKIVDGEVKEQYEIPLVFKKANVKLNDIGVEAFPDKLATYSTRYDASVYGRSKNLQIAVKKINGTVIMPGETFSFNGVVGERTAADGYTNAKIYSNGQVVDGLAGGICQISSTLYNTALIANLEITERFNHSFITSYIAAGRDATVVYGIKDLKFKNNRNYPIKIEGNVNSGIVTFNIYGVKEEEEYVIKIIPRTTQTIPFTEQIIPDNTLAPNTMKVIQKGANGFKVTTHKEKYLNGKLISKEVLSNDVYRPMTRVVRMGEIIEAPKPKVEEPKNENVIPEGNLSSGGENKKPEGNQEVRDPFGN